MNTQQKLHAYKYTTTAESGEEIVDYVSAHSMRDALSNAERRGEPYPITKLEDVGEIEYVPVLFRSSFDTYTISENGTTLGGHAVGLTIEQYDLVDEVRNWIFDQERDYSLKDDEWQQFCRPIFNALK